MFGYLQNTIRKCSEYTRDETFFHTYSIILISSFFLLQVLPSPKNLVFIFINFIHCYNLPMYRSCIALFYRKRLPQQNGDRRIGERETSMHLIVCGSEVGTRALPSPPTCNKRQAWVHYGCPPPPLNSTQTGQFQ